MPPFSGTKSDRGKWDSKPQTWGTKADWGMLHPEFHLESWDPGVHACVPGLGVSEFRGEFGELGFSFVGLSEAFGEFWRRLCSVGAGWDWDCDRGKVCALRAMPPNHGTLADWGRIEFASHECGVETSLSLGKSGRVWFW